MKRLTYIQKKLNLFFLFVIILLMAVLQDLIIATIKSSFGNLYCISFFPNRTIKTSLLCIFNMLVFEQNINICFMFKCTNQIQGDANKKLFCVYIFKQSGLNKGLTGKQLL